MRSKLAKSVVEMSTTRSHRPLVEWIATAAGIPLQRGHDCPRVARPDLYGRDRPHDVGFGLCRESQRKASNDALPHEAIDPVLNRASRHTEDSSQCGGRQTGITAKEFDQSLVRFIQPHAFCRSVNSLVIMRKDIAKSIASLASC